MSAQRKQKRIMWWSEENISMRCEIGPHYKVDNDFFKTFQELKPPDYDAKPAQNIWFSHRSSFFLHCQNNQNNIIHTILSRIS